MNPELFNDLLLSAKEAVEISKGKKKPARITKVELPDVKVIRAKTELLFEFVYEHGE